MKSLLLATTMSLLVSPVFALPTIANNAALNVTGTATFDATTITFVNPGDIPTAGTTLSFTELGSSCTGCAVVNSPITYSPFTAGLLYTVTHAGNTATFTTTSNTLTQVVGGTDLIIHDNGIFTLTGFAATKGIIDITINQITGIASGSFSSTGVSSGGGGGSVPEPATLALLGTALVGLGAARRFVR